MVFSPINATAPSMPAFYSSAGLPPDAHHTIFRLRRMAQQMEGLLSAPSSEERDRFISLSESGQPEELETQLRSYGPGILTGLNSEQWNRLEEFALQGEETNAALVSVASKFEREMGFCTPLRLTLWGHASRPIDFAETKFPLGAMHLFLQEPSTGIAYKGHKLFYVDGSEGSADEDEALATAWLTRRDLPVMTEEEQDIDKLAELHLAGRHIAPFSPASLARAFESIAGLVRLGSLTLLGIHSDRLANVSDQVMMSWRHIVDVVVIGGLFTHAEETLQNLANALEPRVVLVAKEGEYPFDVQGNTAFFNLKLIRQENMEMRFDPVAGGEGRIVLDTGNMQPTISLKKASRIKQRLRDLASMLVKTETGGLHDAVTDAAFNYLHYLESMPDEAGDVAWKKQVALEQYEEYLKRHAAGEPETSEDQLAEAFRKLIRRSGYLR